MHIMIYSTLFRFFALVCSSVSASGINPLFNVKTEAERTLTTAYNFSLEDCVETTCPLAANSTISLGDNGVISTILKPDGSAYSGVMVDNKDCKLILISVSRTTPKENGSDNFLAKCGEKWISHSECENNDFCLIAESKNATIFVLDMQ